jgi:hypothetical protein
MRRPQERRFSAIRDAEPLDILVQLHFLLLYLSPYDAVARETWFDEAQSLLALANDNSQQSEWLLSLAWAYKKHLGQGIPVCMIMGRLLTTKGAGMKRQAS